MNLSTFSCAAATTILFGLCRITVAGPLVADDHTLFLAHYDKSLTADFAKGNARTVAGAAAITSGKKGKFDEGVNCTTGPATDANGQSIQFTQLSYDSKNNIDLARGTVEFWTRLADAGNVLPGKLRLRYFFDIPTSEKDSVSNIIRVTIVMTERDGTQILYAFPGTLIAQGVSTGHGESISIPILWRSDEWHHIAFTWDGTRAVLFADGKASAPLPLPGGLFGGNKTNTDALEGVFLIGGLFKSGPGNAPDGVIDEFRISNNVRYINDFDPSK